LVRTKVIFVTVLRYRVSTEQISQLGISSFFFDSLIFLGGDILVQNNGGLINVLKMVYPNYIFQETYFSRRGKKASQRWLMLKVGEVFDDKFSRFYELSFTYYIKRHS
jgi:hypothetical protein